MKISVDHIKDTPLVLHFEEQLDMFAILSDMQKKKECFFSGCVQGDVSVVREYGHLRVTGRATVPVMLSCSRCLAEYESQVGTSFTVFFRKETVNRGGSEDELELGEEDLVSSLYTGDEIDLTPEFDEQIAMEIPLNPICSHSCKGLCQFCGVDLNVSHCSCERETTGFKFSALKNFNVTR